MFFSTACLNPTPEPVISLTWWVTLAPESKVYPVLEKIAQSYSDKTGVEIELESVPWTDIAPRFYGQTQLALAQEKGLGPDLFGPVPHTWTGGLVAQEQVLALEAEQVLDTLYYPNETLWACQVEGIQYGLPVLFDSVALIYNRRLVSEPPQTFEDVQTIVDEFTDPEADRWGLVLPLVSQYHTFPFIEGYGGYVFNCQRGICDGNDLGLNTEGAVQGIQFLTDLYVKEKRFPEPLIDRSIMADHALELFTSGRAAMLIDGPWAVPDIQASGIDYGVIELPMLPETTRRPRSLTLAQAVFVGADTAYSQEAIDFANALAGPDYAVELQSVLGRVPVRKDVMRLNAFRNDREMQTWYKQAVAGVLLPNALELEALWYPWGYALEVAVPGLKPVQAALDDAVSEFKGYFEEESTE